MNVFVAAIVKGLVEKKSASAFFRSTLGLKWYLREAQLEGLIGKTNKLTKKGRTFYEKEGLAELPDKPAIEWELQTYETVVKKVAGPVAARLAIQVEVNCPQCGEVVDLLRDMSLNEDGGILQAVISDEAWKVAAKERLECSCTCPYCKFGFEVRGVEW